MQVLSSPELKSGDFRRFQSFLETRVGIHLADMKKPLLAGRLSKRLAQLGISRFSDYLALVLKDPAEQQVAIDLLTTNETFFWREPKHFEFLAHHADTHWRRQPKVRVWCGASSTGEEPYTIAMVLHDVLGAGRFEIMASDISTRVLDIAREAIYPAEDMEPIPRPLRPRYCLKGVGSQQGRFMVHPSISSCVQFSQVNLNQPLPSFGLFDAIFLRNVMIYFALETKRQVVGRVLRHLRPGGLFFISHSETLHGVSSEVQAVRPSVYCLKET